MVPHPPLLPGGQIGTSGRSLHTNFSKPPPRGRCLAPTCPGSESQPRREGAESGEKGGGVEGREEGERKGGRRRRREGGGGEGREEGKKGGGGGRGRRGGREGGEGKEEGKGRREWKGRRKERWEGGGGGRRERRKETGRGRRKGKQSKGVGEGSSKKKIQTHGGTSEITLQSTSNFTCAWNSSLDQELRVSWNSVTNECMQLLAYSTLRRSHLKLVSSPNTLYTYGNG